MKSYYIIIFLIALFLILGYVFQQKTNNQKVSFIITPSKNDIYYHYIDNRFYER